MLVPLVWPYMPAIESRINPVVTKAEVELIHVNEKGVSFFVAFKKRRNCDFLGANWYDGDRRLTLEFEPDAKYSPGSRPVGGQFTGP